MNVLRGRRDGEPGVEESRCRTTAAFTLLEVMIAGGILFMCLFAILGLLANTLRNARALQRTPVDAGILAAQLSLTNKLAEGSDAGDFSDFGDAYRNYQWKSETTEITNGFFQVDFVVTSRSGQHGGESHLSIFLFRPDSVRTRP